MEIVLLIVNNGCLIFIDPSGDEDKEYGDHSSVHEADPLGRGPHEVWGERGWRRVRVDGREPTAEEISDRGK